MAKESYRKLREKLHKFPLGAPEMAEIYEILEIIFTEEEAEIGAKLPAFPEHIDSLAEKTGVEKEKLIPVLEGLADKGCVFKFVKDGAPHYSLLPMVPGIFEFQFMKGEYGPIKSRLAKLFNDYYHKGWGNETYNLKTPLARIIPVKKTYPSGRRFLPTKRSPS